ncbi:MAG: TetR family transcriptional regulator [Comamonadaceae bacterium]|nr:MAG: TetR family transcriptional regulator [Comamonadaceae bacterium]
MGRSATAARTTAPAASQPGVAKATRPRASRRLITERIRRAAIREFSMHGLHGASTQAIAEGAGLTKPQLHYYIVGKEELYVQLLGEVVAEWSDDEFGLDETDPEAALRGYIEAKVQRAMAHPELTRLFALEMVAGGTYLRKYWPQSVKVTGRLVAALERWIAAGRLRPLEPLALLMNIWAMTSHYADWAAQVRVMQKSFPQAARLDGTTISREISDLVVAGCLPR